MSRSAIVVTGILPDAVNVALDAGFSVTRTILQHEGVEALLANISNARAIVVIPGDPINRGLIERLPSHVGLIASYSTGLDHIDLDAAQERNIRVTNTPDVLTDATADIAMLLLLGVLRGAAAAVPLIQSGTWSGWQPAQIFGWDVKGKTLGIFGGGRIGAATAKRAAAFGMKLCYHSRSRNSELDALGAGFIENRADFWSSANVISLHAPSTAETRNVVSVSSIKQMQPGAFIINTARGDLIDDDAVLDALASGQLAGIGLDVFRGEPSLDSRYRSHPKAFILPHVGSATHETRLAMGQSVLQALRSFFLATV